MPPWLAQALQAQIPQEANWLVTLSLGDIDLPDEIKAACCQNPQGLPSVVTLLLTRYTTDVLDNLYAISIPYHLAGAGPGGDFPQK